MFDQVLKRVVHGPRLGVTGVEKHQHQVREINDVVGDLQRGGTLGIGIKAWGINDDAASYLIARARL